ncbi:MAG: division/cell wall cluster transcriptional repressor MraZ [Bdellovibrionota bacterium]
MVDKFRGRFSVKLDPKGRMALPTRLRDCFAENKDIVITNSLFKGLPFLDVYPQKKWQQLEKQIDALPEFRPEVQAFQRFYLASGTPVEMDAQGRFLVPYDLRSYGKLKSDIVIVGMGDRFEIWDSSQWNKVFSEFKKDFDSITHVLADLSDASAAKGKK